MDMITRPAKEDDWDWISQQHAQTAWESLSPERQSEVSVDDVASKLADQVAKSREQHGITNQVFVAFDSTGNRNGFVWVDQILSGFTGKPQAYILDVVVLKEYRRKGIGRMLMAEAEAWAKRNGFDYIGLSVSSRNEAAIALYREEGFEIETFRMWKKIG